MQHSPPDSAQTAAADASIELSIVIPAFNEEPVLQKCLEAVEDYAQKQTPTYEIIVVDDGSADRTSEIARAFKSGRNHMALLNNDRNRGKGFAVQRGMLAARGKLILFLDADLSTRPEEFDHLKEWFQQGYDSVIGTRRTEGAHIERHQSFLREKMGTIFTLLSRWLLGLTVSDFTCGFKCFSLEAAHSIFSLQTLHDWSFDAEILYIAKRQGFRVKEVPVNWKNADDSKVHIIRDSIRSLVGLLRIRINSLRGKYGLS